MKLVDKDRAGSSLHLRSKGSERDQPYLFFFLIVGLGDELDDASENLYV